MKDQSGSVPLQGAHDQQDNVMLECLNVHKSFGLLRVLEGVDLTVRQGEIRGLIGPNGAGKSTLMHMVAGVVPLTSGAVHFNGVDISKYTEHRRAQMGIGMKFQVSTVFQEETVADNVLLAAQCHERTGRLIWGRVRRKCKESVDEILNTVGLYEKQDVLARHLSHGETQWLEIGMVLATKAELLLLDEPTSGMSPEETRNTAKLLSRLSEHCTILVTEHDIGFIKSISHRLTVLHQGHFIMEGSAEEVEQDDMVRSCYLGRVAV